MALDAFKNLSFTTVATAPAPAASGTSLDVAAGTGTRFPAVPFNATVWPANTMPDPTTAEIVRVTGISTDTLTITRTQEGTSARTIVAGDQIAATVTALTLDTLSAEIATVSALVTTVSALVTIASALATTAETHAGTASAAATTADAHANTVSAAVTVASALATTADTHANTVSAQLVSVSAVFTTNIAALSSQVASADTALSVRINLLGGIVSVTSVELGVVSALITTLSAATTSADNTVSATAATAHNVVSAQLVSVSAALTSAIQVASAAANTVSAQLVSVSAAITTAIQVASAAATSADGHANTVSVAVVGRAPWISAVYAIVANSQTINTSAIAGVSALTFALAANSLWQFEGIVYVSVSAVAGGLRFGTSVSGGLAAGPRFMWAETYAGSGVNPQAAAGQLAGFGLIGQSGLTTILSATSVASAGLAFPILFNGTVLASASGNVQIAAGTIASSAASPAIVLAGSYIKAFRLS